MEKCTDNGLCVNDTNLNFVDELSADTDTSSASLLEDAILSKLVPNNVNGEVQTIKAISPMTVESKESDKCDQNIDTGSNSNLSFIASTEFGDGTDDGTSCVVNMKELPGTDMHSISSLSFCASNRDEDEESKPECDKQYLCSNGTNYASLLPTSCSSTNNDTNSSICNNTNNVVSVNTSSKNIKTKTKNCDNGVPSAVKPPSFTFNNTTSTNRVAHCKPLHSASVFPLRKPNVSHHSRYSRNRGGFDSLNINHSNSSIMTNYPNRLVDFFKSRKMFRTSPTTGKRSNHYIPNKTPRPSSSAACRSKQVLLASMSACLTSKSVGNIVDDNKLVSQDSNSKLSNNSILPVPVMVHVFSYLPLYDLLCCASQVCKYWYSTVIDPALWRYINLSEQNKLTDEILLRLTSISDNVLGINLSTRGGPLQLNPDTISTCLQRSPNLQELRMPRCFDVPSEAFISIGEFCHNLVHLDLDICSNVTNETIIAVGKGCPKLRVLFLGQCSNVKNTGIVEVARGCPSLQQLKIEQCDKITDHGVIELTKYCLGINYLHMLSCSLTDSSICQLIKLKELRVLDISNVTQLSPKVLTKVVQHCVKLEVLNVSLNRAVGDDCIKMIVMSCPKLRILSCVACRLTDNALIHVGEYGKCIEHLDVAWCVDITNSGVRQISNTCSTLHYLGLMQCRKVTCDTIDEMIENHPDIHYSNFVTETRRIMKKACMAVDDEFQTLKVLS